MAKLREQAPQASCKEGEIYRYDFLKFPEARLTDVKSQELIIAGTGSSIKIAETTQAPLTRIKFRQAEDGVMVDHDVAIPTNFLDWLNSRTRTDKFCTDPLTGETVWIQGSSEIEVVEDAGTTPVVRIIITKEDGGKTEEHSVDPGNLEIFLQRACTPISQAQEPATPAETTDLQKGLNKALSAVTR